MRRENLIVRQILDRVITWHRLVIGSPEQLADAIKECSVRGRRAAEPRAQKNPFCGGAVPLTRSAPTAVAFRNAGLCVDTVRMLRQCRSWP